MKASGLHIVWAVVLAGCAAAATAPPAASPAQPALLLANDAACVSAIADAARRLTGHTVTLAADAFLQNDSVVLTSAGQMADGRLAPAVASAAIAACAGRLRNAHGRTRRGHSPQTMPLPTAYRAIVGLPWKHGHG